MPKFYFKYALRSLLRNRNYTGLNIMGLSVGLAVSLIVYLYLHHELTYDTHIKNHEQIYRVNSELVINGITEHNAGTGLSLGPFLKDNYSFIKGATRLMHFDENVLFKHKNIKESASEVVITDAHFFEVFDIPFIAGNRDTALKHARSMVVTTSFAKTFFGDENPVGQKISTSNFEYTITGLIADMPTNTHHYFSALISAFEDDYDKDKMVESLWSTEVFTFLRIENSQQAISLEQAFEASKDDFGQTTSAALGANSIKLSALNSIHFDHGLLLDRPTSDVKYLYAFGLIGLLILILACINYVNMATIRGLKKASDAGMQKIIGARPIEIMAQVIAESLILSLAAMFLSLVIVELILSLTPLNAVLNKDLELNFFTNLNLWWFPLVLSVLVAFLSGLYPAIYLSKVPEIAVIKRHVVKANKGLSLRKALVGFQFMVSVAVVITAVLMYRQMEYITTKDLGFNKENIVLIPLQDTLTINKVPEIRKALAQSKYIEATSTAYGIPGKATERTFIRAKNTDWAKEQRVVDIMWVGTDYLKTMEIDLLQGETFSGMYGGEAEFPIIINHTAAKLLDMENPIGQTLDIAALHLQDDYTAEIIGVVEDFNAHSLHQKIEPAILTLQELDLGYLHIRIKPDNEADGLNDIEMALARVRPDIPFHFSFLNEALKDLYQDEERQSLLILFLTYVAVFMSVLGLVGLASFTTSLRLREVSIRKVLGADVGQMVRLIFKDTLILIVVAVAMALPLAFVLIREWLYNFAYTASLNSSIFILAGLAAILIAYMVIAWHALKIARTKPIENLRYE